MSNDIRPYLLSCAALLVTLPFQANAQSAAPQSSDSPAAADSGPEITVTGSRIRQDGYDAPVPVSVVGPEELAAQRPASIGDFLNTLPSVTAGGLSSVSGSGNISAGTAGINTVNLRGLGAGRTLVLIDGHRSPPSTNNGLVDLNTIPQDLIQRVEVVTGGASAQYGSDAIGGVVNFILDTKFSGLKMGADAGVSTYGDAENYRYSASAGLHLLDDRLHILLNGSYFRQVGVDSIDRPWAHQGAFTYQNPNYAAGNGQPQYIVGRNGIGTTYLPYGLINSGPLRGTYFLQPGVTGNFNYGVSNATSAPYIVGGDYKLSNEGVEGANSLLPDEQRASAFGRVAFDVTPDVTLFGQFSWNRYNGTGYYGALPNSATILSDNAYLQSLYPQVAAQVQANNLSSVSLSTYNTGLPYIGSDATRNVYRYLVGAQGKFDAIGRSWSWDVSYQKGIVKTIERAINAYNTSRLALATDAVYSNGQIVCRSTLTAPTNGCVPINRLGTTPPSAAALAYIYGPQQPVRYQTIKQDNVAANVNGELFDLPGGTAAIAIGAEWRKDQVSGDVGSTALNSYAAGNFRATQGEITVKEGYLEVALPILKSLNLDAAGRVTDYSTSGTVGTWKFGGSFSPVDGVKFRTSYSHDIRAPNISELFAPQSTGAFVATLPANSPSPGNVTTQRTVIGNTNLDPERANTFTAGVVLTPRAVSGLSLSVDYYDIKIKDAISAPGAQSVVDFCYAGYSQFCSSLVYNGSQLVTILQQPQNYASQHLKGIDFEASYRVPMSSISSKLPGEFRISAAVTHYITNKLDNGVQVVDYAGMIQDATFGNGSSPKWVYRISAFYDADPVMLNVVARGFNSGVVDSTFVECTSGCPTSTALNRTINDNRSPGRIYFDTSIFVRLPFLGDETRLGLIVNNVMNKAPAENFFSPSGFSVSYPQTARPTYDTVGRTFKLSLTTKL